MKRLIIIGIVAASLGMTGCYYFGPCIDGSGPVLGEVRQLDGFNGVTNSGSFDVYVTLADEFHVEVVAHENLIPIIETEVSGNTLIIDTEEGACFRSSTPVEVYVSLPELEELNLTGSGELIAEKAEASFFDLSNSGSGFLSVDSIYADNFSVKNTGSGTIEVEEIQSAELNLVQSGSGTIDAGDLYGSGEVSIRHSSSGRVRLTVIDGNIVDAVMSGSGRTDLFGEALQASYTLSSSGKMDALELVVEDADATNTGSGNIFLWATETLNATITGSGDIIFRGEPIVSFQITGSGNVRSY
jgi:hypothetical protein